MKLKTLAAGVALALASAGSFAASALTFTYSADGLTKTAGLFGSHGVGDWTDTFYFSLLEPGYINGSAISIKLGALADWDFDSITLSNGSSSWAFAPTAGSSDDLEVFTLDPVSIGPGNYTLTITGSVGNGAVLGSYGGNINISAVPEPETYALMLAGLGAIGLVASRRRVQR